MEQSYIIRPSELCRKLNLSRTTIWRMEVKGELPQRKKVGERAVGWLSTDIEKWMGDLPDYRHNANPENY
jgi:predicted DNA-binding transcriptional regulator AlpA